MIVIDTIGVFSTNPPLRMQESEKQEGEEFLRKLAEDHGGVFVNGSDGKG